MRRLGAFLLALALLAGVAPLGRAAAPTSCGVTDSTDVFQGDFTTTQEGSYVLVPFSVPSGSTRVQVRLCHDQAPLWVSGVPSNPTPKHTLDLGLYQPSTDGFYDQEEFRGWGGSSRLNVLVTPEQATNGFIPGPIPPGTWAAEIGVASVADVTEGDPDGSVAWRLEVKVESRPDDTDTPWVPRSYDTKPARDEAGWYKGDFHVHAEHSNAPGGGATMTETLDYAFGDSADDQAGLDFIALSDYVTTRHWDEIGLLQPDYPRKLILRSAEVITYRGHTNNHGSLDWADYRTGPIYVREPSGSLTKVRDPMPPGAPGGIFDDVHEHGGWTQVNHPTIFPSAVPFFDGMCRGCPWDFSDDETDWSKVDAFEVQTGPAGTPGQQSGIAPPVDIDGLLGPNPFTPLAVEWYDRLHRSGFDITAVGVSDSHDADHQELTQSPVGEATTVVLADGLSEQGIGDGVRAGHAYVKFFGAGGPDLRLEAAVPGPERPAIMGDEVKATSMTLRATVTGQAAQPGPLTLVFLRDGVPVEIVPVSATPFETTLPVVVPGDWRIQLMRGSAIEALTNPITLVVPGNPLSHTHVG